MTKNNYILLRKASANCKRILKQTKQEAWINYCNNLNRQTSTSQIWNQIKWFTHKKLTNASSYPDNISEILQILTPDTVEYDFLDNKGQSLIGNSYLNYETTLDEIVYNIP